MRQGVACGSRHQVRVHVWFLVSRDGDVHPCHGPAGPQRPRRALHVGRELRGQFGRELVVVLVVLDEAHDQPPGEPRTVVEPDVGDGELGDGNEQPEASRGATGQRRPHSVRGSVIDE